MNKSFLLILFCLLCLNTLEAQEYSFGVKAGANYNMGGEVTGNDSGEGYFDGTVTADPKIGFHGGVFFQLKIGKILIRPEVYYSVLETEFQFRSRPSIYSVDRLTIPLLVGYNVYGPIDVYAGPAYHSIISATLEGTQPADKEIIVQNSPLALQAGIKANIGKFEVDLRYDRSLASREDDPNLDFDNGNFGINRAPENDFRLNQILLSLSFKIFDSEKSTARRGRGCYF